ncbi:UNVERIFIED_CONTAM: hypothetical protein FKN15_005325 [Acipenser sinensis]
MLSVEGTVNFEPVLFSIHSGSEDSDEGSDSEFQVSLRLTEKEFCKSVESSGRSWEETYEILLNYHQKLLKQLKARKKYVDKIRSQIIDTMRSKYLVWLIPHAVENEPVLPVLWGLSVSSGAMKM